MNDGPGTEMTTNRLANETSPYLLQHQHNPVDWYPWGQKALDEAKRRDVPIFLSIGYSTCHWCHVMAHETFEDPDMARAMNDHFVNIKVDREERPDIDAIYMQAVQAMGSQGGWPLNLFLTPDGKPFFGGTYWPKHDRPPMPGFQRVLMTISARWRDDRDNLIAGSERVAAYLRDSARATPNRSPVTPELSVKAIDTLEQQFDPMYGGFGGAPKFPQASILRFLLRHWHRTGDSRALRMTEDTLSMMAEGGIHDQIGGGFARYSTDERWHVPHFEKMLYDNAQLLDLYTELWTITRDDLYRDVARGIVTWLAREMIADGGAFAAAQDADSEGIEGKYYIWSAREVDDLLSPETADLVKLHYGITDPGSFEGKTVLSIVKPVEEIAEQTGRNLDDVRHTIDKAKAKMLAARQQRVAPGRDDKVLTGWNGLMIQALAHAGNVFGEDEWIAMASRAARFILDRMTGDNGALWRSWNAGSTRGHGVLEDYACLASGLIELYTVTADRTWLDRATTIAGYARQHFRHDSGVGFYDTDDRSESLITRPREVTDTALPSGNGKMAEVLMVLGVMTQSAEMTDEGAAIVESMARPMADHPMFTGQYLCVAQRMLESPKELVFAGNPTSGVIRQLRRAVASRFEPLLIIGFSDPADPDAATRFPMLAGRPVVGDGATYVCENFTCKPAVTTPDELTALLQRIAY